MRSQQLTVMCRLLSLLQVFIHISDQVNTHIIISGENSTLLYCINSISETMKNYAECYWLIEVYFTLTQ